MPLATRPAVNVEAGGGGDDPARGHPADERALTFPQVRPERGRERGKRTGHQDQHSDQAEGGQQQMPERLRGHGRRDGDEQDADDQLHQRLEERLAGREVNAPHIGQGEPHENRRDEPGVRPDRVAPGGHPDHRGKLRGRAEQLTEPELAQQQPEHHGADHPSGQADQDTNGKLPELVAQTFMGARDNSMEDQRAENSADRVNQ